MVMMMMMMMMTMMMMMMMIVVMVGMENQRTHIKGETMRSISVGSVKTSVRCSTFPHNKITRTKQQGGPLLYSCKWSYGAPINGLKNGYITGVITYTYRNQNHPTNSISNS